MINNISTFTIKRFPKVIFGHGAFNEIPEEINIALDYAHEKKDGFIKGILCPDMTLLESDIKRVY